MNLFEQKMIHLLVRLNQQHSVNFVKAEFEAEATRLDEAMRLKEIVDRAGLDLVIKIGGAEAIRDMFDAQLLGVAGVVAPMIESSYALSKYLDAVETFFPQELKDKMFFGVNIETLQGFINLKEILGGTNNRRMSVLTIGRVDLACSLGLGRNSINDEIIYEITQNICLMAKAKGIRTTIGGGIAFEAIDFITALAKKKLIDRFETRKIVFDVNPSTNNIQKGILLANEFELLWLENKRNYYGAIFREDDKRISMLKKRLNNGLKNGKDNG